MQSMSEQLTRAAKARHTAAALKATTALRELSVAHAPITFVAVARRAGVSTDFLYRQPALRAAITSMRTGGHSPALPVIVGEPSDSPSAAVRALSARLKELQSKHRTDVAELERALATAHGENLALRRRLAAYEG